MMAPVPSGVSLIDGISTVPTTRSGRLPARLPDPSPPLTVARVTMSPTWAPIRSRSTRPSAISPGRCGSRPDSTGIGDRPLTRRSATPVVTTPSIRTLPPSPTVTAVDPRVRGDRGRVVRLGVDGGEVGDPAVPRRGVHQPVEAGGEGPHGHDTRDAEHRDQRGDPDRDGGPAARPAQREGEAGQGRRPPAEPGQRCQRPGARGRRRRPAHHPGRGDRRQQQERHHRDSGAPGRRPAGRRGSRGAARSS